MADIGIDLGSENCRVYIKDNDRVFMEPAIVAVYKNRKEVVGVGDEVAKLVSSNTDLKRIHPIRHGILAEFELIDDFIAYFIGKTGKYLKNKQPELLISFSSNACTVEINALTAAALKAGCNKATYLPVCTPYMYFVNSLKKEKGAIVHVDIGAGESKITIVSDTEIINSATLRIAGGYMTDDINQYYKTKYSIRIEDQTAENIKKHIGLSHFQKKEVKMPAKGHSLKSESPVEIEINACEVFEALQEAITTITDKITATITECPENYICGLKKNGIILTGGGAMMTGLADFISEKTALNCQVAESPEDAAINGLKMIINKQ